MIGALIVGLVIFVVGMAAGLVFGLVLGPRIERVNAEWLGK